MSKKKAEASAERELDINLVDRPERVSRFEIPDEEISDLAASIKERGLLQAIRVSEKGGRFEVVFGDRRYLAHKKLGLQTIRAVVKAYNPLDIAIDRATENNQRNNLSPIEEASEYANLHDNHNMSWNEIGKMLGRTGGIIKRRVLLLGYDEGIQRALHHRKIMIGVAEELARCPDDTHREYLLEMCVEHGVTVIVVRQWVNDFLSALRRERVDIGGGGEEMTVYSSNPIFRACELCKEPVDIQKMQHIEACPACRDTIVKLVKGEG